MESKKQFKEEKNVKIKTTPGKDGVSPEENPNFAKFESQFNFSPQTENLLKANVSQQAMENIRHIFNKTQTIRKVADVKHQEIQAQFKELRERLNNSSECLHRMKKGIDNIKFSYQTKIFEMQKALTPGDCFDKDKNPPQTKEEVAKQMEEIRDKIEKIQSQVYSEKEKQEKVMQGYQDAFENVSAMLQSIDKGDYSSLSVTNAKDSQ